jgi:hypothetical protein
MLGRSLYVLNGPNAQCARWSSLFQMACSGQKSQDRLLVLANPATDTLTERLVFVTCTPVAASGGSQSLSHILVTFEYAHEEFPASSNGIAALAEISRSEPTHMDPYASNDPHPLYCPSVSPYPVQCPNLSNDNAPFRCPPACPSSTAAAPAPPIAPLTSRLPTPCSESGAAIRPRPRGGTGASGVGAGGGPVVITLEVLRGLDDIPLYRAAALLGVSPSSLKNACRRLGLRRWADSRAAARAAAAGESSPSASAVSAAAGRGALDVAYARRLYRKYAARGAGAGAARRAGSAPAAHAAPTSVAAGWPTGAACAAVEEEEEEEKEWGLEGLKGLAIDWDEVL